MNPLRLAVILQVGVVAVGVTACAEATSIDSATVTCDGNTAVFTLETSGDGPSAASVFSQETGNPTPNFADEHDFLEADGVRGTLTLELATGGSRGVEGETLFTCAAHHGDPQGIMTYAYRVYDEFGDLSDCIVQGDNPDALIEGGNRVGGGDPSSPGELDGCSTAPGTY